MALMGPRLPPEEPSRFQFDGFFVDKVSLDLIPRAERGEDETRPKTVDCRVSTSGQLVVNAQIRRSELSLTFNLETDPKWQPYVITVSVVGRFSQASGPIEEFNQFLRMGAPAILFPYVRAIVESLTRDSRYGRVRVSPINIQAMMGWVEDTTSSIEPTQPSLQLPDASPESEPQP